MDYFGIVMATIGPDGLLYIGLGLVAAALAAWLLYTLIWRAVKRGIREAASEGLGRQSAPLETRPISPN